MTLRTRRWPVALAALLFVAACTGPVAPTATPTGAGPTGTPAPGTTGPTDTGTPGPTDTGASPEPTDTGASPEPTDTGASPEPTDGASGAPGGTLIFAEWQTPSQLNPFFSTSFTTFESLAPALRGLLTIDESGTWVTDLGVEVPSADNGGVEILADAPADCRTADAPTGECFKLNLEIKPGLMWSDGKPNDLNDFLATYEKAAEWGAAGVGCSGCATMVPLINPTLEEDPYQASNRYISNIEVAADGLSMVVTWQKNYAGWLGWASSAMLQKDWVTPITGEQAPSAMPVGPGIEAVPWNGPFTITAASTSGIDYARNDMWKASEPALLDNLREVFYAAKDGMITDFLAGNVDLALNMTQADFPAVDAVDPGIGRAQLDSVWQYEHFDLMSAGGTRLGGTVTNKGLDDVEVRTAIAMAVDKVDLVNVLFPGMGVEPACSVAPPGTPWRDDTVECAPYDPAGAMAKLDAAGWVVNEATALREKDVDGDGTNEALRLQLCTTAGNPTRLTQLSKLNQYLAAIGIPSDVTTADAASVVFAGWADTTDDTNCSIYRGTYDVADFAFVLGGDVYSNYYFSYHSSQIPSDDNPNGSNSTRINDPAMDEALDALGVEVDPEAQLEHASTVQHTIATYNNEIPIYYRAETTGISNHVGGFGAYNPSSAGPTWNVEKWFFIP